MCDLRVRGLGFSATNQHEHIIQCTLPLNFFLQQLFTCLWIWLVLLSIINTIDFCTWLYYILPKTKERFILDHLRYEIDRDKSFVMDCPEPGKQSKNNHVESLTDFIENYLGVDGYFVLKLMSLNCGRLATRIMIVNLAEKHRSENKHLFKEIS